jgi:hypothetical protein
VSQATHREAWAGALLCFTLFTALFVATELGGHHSLVVFLRAIAFGAAVALFCIGWTMRQREKDEPAMRHILAERERRLLDEHYRDAV